MVRRSTPSALLAEWYFPVRLRVKVPPGGFGVQIDELHSWLDRHVGRGDYWVGSSSRAGTDCALFYFVDVNSAHAFAERFDRLTLCIGRDEVRPR